MIAFEVIEHRLVAALAECERLREENRQLRERVGFVQIETQNPQSPPSVTTPVATAAPPFLSS
jgi:hypothetical protein